VKNKKKLHFSCRLLFCFILCAISTNLHAQNLLPSRELNWNSIQFQEITIYFTEPDLRPAEQVQTILDNVFVDLKQTLQIESEIEIQIYICPSPAIFREIIGSRLPEWSEAVYMSHRKAIVLKSPYWSGSNRNQGATVVHELVHAVLDQRVNYQSIPRWLNEGLAVAFSGERDLASNSLISKAAATNSLIPLDQIDDVLNFHKDRARLAYQQSYLATQFIIETYDFSAINTILDGIRQGWTLNTIFQNAFSTTFYEFETRWREHIRTDRRWDLLIDLPSLLWPMMGVLFLVVVTVMFIRNRKRMREWEEE
jgi:hypothetical protein